MHSTTHITERVKAPQDNNVQEKYYNDRERKIALFISLLSQSQNNTHVTL